MQEPGRRRGTPPFAGVDLRRPKGYPESAPAEAGDPCPRCESRDTKFCYYNNYNTSQPRHYCKSCRRYWTKGGSLRNVPVGGSSRKGSSASSSSTSPSAPKRAKNSKRRRVAPAPTPEPEPSTDASAAAAADAATTEAATAKSTADDPAAPPAADGGFTDTVAHAADAATTEAATKSTADDPAPAAAAPAADGGSTDPPEVALGLVGLTAAGAKEPASDASSFEWPSGCDLESYWGNGVFADTDPALFLNLP